MEGRRERRRVGEGCVEERERGKDEEKGETLEGKKGWIMEGREDESGRREGGREK